MIVTHAMVLAAGLGKRLRPITETLPKPLVRIAGQTLIDRILDRLVDAGVTDAVVNLHHHADLLAAHLAARARPRLTLLRETTLLETGGGVRNALPHLGAGPFFVVNGDILWRDGKRAVLERAASHWDDSTMDALIVLQRTVWAVGYDGDGDFMLSAAGQVHRPGPGEIPPYLFAGVQLLHPRLFEGAPEGAFSLARLYDHAARRGRLGGIVHDGEWYHAGTPEALREIEERLGRGDVWRSG